MRSPKEMERLRTRLVRAGYKSPSAPAIYTLLEYVLPVVAAVFVFAAAPPYRLFVTGGVGLLLFFAPSTLLDRTLSKRRREIENGLPDALDLLVVCIEAGSGIDQAIVRTGEELSLAYPALGDELRLLTMEIRAGKPRLEAFRNLAQRSKSDDVRALVAMLIQTDRFGTSVGQALRTHADVSRSKRRQRAEEQAQKIGVKLVFPLVFFFFPAFYVVVLGPAFLQFVRAFGSH
jgi:tight adherence protein C